jgi:hypothetical protein
MGFIYDLGLNKNSMFAASFGLLFRPFALLNLATQGGKA